MSITLRQVGFLAAAFLIGVVVLVFQQIHTSMTEQGIASGGPYDNAAAYPRAVAIVIGLLVFAQLVIDGVGRRTSDREAMVIPLKTLRRPVFLLLVFGIYLWLLSWLGYHLTTAPMIFAVMWICGARQVLRMVIVSLAMAFIAAYIFENFLNIVLPGGLFGLNIPW